MKFITGASTDIGGIREMNQDAICVIEAETLKGSVGMLIVCDGMGGLSKGEVASAVVVKGFERWFEEKLPILIEQYKVDALRHLWMEELRHWDKKIKQYGMENGILLGTTFSGLLLINNRYLWVHVGDSRIYKISPGRAIQMTTDHTAIARELALGTMTQEEAKYSKLRNQLTQCIGASKFLEPESGSGHVKPGESFLVCSDGFYHYFLTEEILRLNDKRYRNASALNTFCEEAIRDVIRRGEKDNISVGVVKIR